MNEEKYRLAERRFWKHYGTATSETWLDLKKPKTKIRVQEVGEGLPLLFLHGGPAAGSIFAPLASQLNHFRCILLDRPGCGLSPAIDYTGDRIDEIMADIVCSVMDALSLKRVPMLTNSFGGACAYWFAQRHPARVTRIAHIGCPAFVSQMSMPFMLRLMATPALGYLAARLPMNRSGVMHFMNTMGQRRAIAQNLLPEEFIDWWISLAQDTETMRNDRELIRNGLTWKGMRLELVIPDKVIQELDLPTYFYWGADEPFATPQFIATLVQGMKNGKVDVIPGSGHLPWFDDPRDAAERAGKFLQGIKS